jgi:ketosteroid isomerase-like protein
MGAPGTGLHAGAATPASYDGYTVTVNELPGDGDKVVALGRYTGTSKASGKPLDAQFAHVWTFRDGKLTNLQQYTDTAQFQQSMKG